MAKIRNMLSVWPETAQHESEFRGSAIGDGVDRRSVNRGRPGLRAEFKHHGRSDGCVARGGVGTEAATFGLDVGEHQKQGRAVTRRFRPFRIHP
jgi:hypothetical protein